MKKPTKRIGELLVEKGLITEGQLYDALREQAAGRRYLGEILIQKDGLPKAIWLKCCLNSSKSLAETLKVRLLIWNWPAGSLLL